MTLDDIRQELRTYDGPPISIMEVCGSHTAAISRLGIPSLLSPAIHLLSGPGCPVCVTPTSYIDRLCDFSLQADTCVVTFGDLLRVPGSGGRTLAACREGSLMFQLRSGMMLTISSPFPARHSNCSRGLSSPGREPSSQAAQGRARHWRMRWRTEAPKA